MRISVVVGLVLLAGATSLHAADWTQLQNGPERKGYSAENIDGPFKLKWTWNRDQASAVRISYFVQPVIGDGRVFLGAADGKMYALDAATGKEAWAFETGGPIMGSAAYDPQSKLVIFGSQDSHVYAVKAGDGTLAWKFKTGEGVWAGILLLSGNVYVGSRDGYFYALDGLGGKLQWQYPARDSQPLAPIYSPASYSPKTGLIYFGARDVRLYAVDAKTGKLAAQSDQLNGADFGWYWPVVLDDKGWVMVRTCNYHNSPWAGPYGKSAAEIRQWIDVNPDRKFFHTLDAKTLKPAFTAPILFQGGCYGRPCPPILDPAGNCYVIRNEKGYMSPCRLVSLNLSDGGFAKEFSDRGAHGGCYRIVGDEGSALSMAGDKIIVSNPQSLGLENIATSKPLAVIRESQRCRDGFGNSADLYIFENKEIPLFTSEQTEPGRQVWHCSPDWTPAPVANKTIYWISDGRALAAVECK